jgi:hypothetical protein
MKSYKTYKSHPSPPEGVNPDWVWQVCDGALPGWTVVNDQDYESYVAGHEDAISAWNAWMDANSSMLFVKNTILSPAMQFGQNLIKEYASENIALGITQAGMAGTVRAVTADITGALNTGSLYDAIAAARAIPALSKDAVFVTDARLLIFINKIEAYLGLPLSEEV